MHSKKKYYTCNQLLQVNKCLSGPFLKIYKFIRNNGIKKTEYLQSEDKPK